MAKKGSFNRSTRRKAVSRGDNPRQWNKLTLIAESMRKPKKRKK